MIKQYCVTARVPRMPLRLPADTGYRDGTGDPDFRCFLFMQGTNQTSAVCFAFVPDLLRTGGITQTHIPSIW